MPRHRTAPPCTSLRRRASPPVPAAPQARRSTAAAAVSIAFLGLSACSDNRLVRAPDGGDPGTGDDDSALGTPDIELEPPTAFLESQCLGPAAGSIRVLSAGTAPLLVDALSNVWADAGALDAEPSASLPVELAPGESLDLSLTWTPAGWEAMAGEVRVTSNDPDEATVVVGLTGDVASDGTEPAVDVEGPPCMTFLQGDPVSLKAIVWDSEDPSLITARWTDSSGTVLQEQPLAPDYTSTLGVSLPEGTEVVTVTIIDSCGSQAHASAEVTVVVSDGTYHGPSPDGLDFDANGYLWVADWESSTVVQLEPDTQAILQRFDIPGTGTDGLTLMGDVMLVSLYYSNEIVVFDPCDGAELDSFPAPGSGVSDVSWDGTHLWVTDYTSWGDVYEVDPATGATLDHRYVPFGSANGLTWDGSNFWMTANGFSNVLARLEPDFSLDQEFAHSGTDPRGIAWDGSRVWYSDGSTAAINSFVP